MLRTICNTFLHYWHSMLDLPRPASRSWYSDRYNEELIELAEATSTLDKISEESDVFFAAIRAKHDGFPIAELPDFQARHALIYGYMLCKYTSRWAFYWTLARLCGAPADSKVREVVNPTKDSKLELVARRHNIDPDQFKAMGRRLRQVWLLFP